MPSLTHSFIHSFLMALPSHHLPCLPSLLLTQSPNWGIKKREIFVTFNISLHDCHHRLRDHAVTWLFPPRPAGKGRKACGDSPRGLAALPPKRRTGRCHPPHSPSTTTPPVPGQLPCSQVAPCPTLISPAVRSKPGLASRKPTGAVPGLAFGAKITENSFVAVFTPGLCWASQAANTGLRFALLSALAYTPRVWC